MSSSLQINHNIMYRKKCEMLFCGKLEYGEHFPCRYGVRLHPIWDSCDAVILMVWFLSQRYAVVGSIVTLHLTCTLGADGSPRGGGCYEHWSLRGLARSSPCAARRAAVDPSRIPADTTNLACSAVNNHKVSSVALLHHWLQPKLRSQQGVRQTFELN